MWQPKLGSTVFINYVTENIPFQSAYSSVNIILWRYRIIYDRSYGRMLDHEISETEGFDVFAIGASA